MQFQCPQCAQRITVDDARVPERPFSLKCPRCQNVLRLPGKGPAGEAPPGPGAEGASAGSGDAAPAPAAPAAPAPEAAADPSVVRPGARALVALPDPAHGAAAAATLGRIGYSVDTLDDVEEGARLLEQGHYTFVMTTRVASAPGKPESLYQRIARLGSESRRRVFLAVVGDEFKTGDGIQAFTILADAVVHARDLSSADRVLRAALADRTRLYQTFLDARARYEAATS